MSGRESRGKGRDRGVAALSCEARHGGSRKIGGRESIVKFERRGKMAEEERAKVACRDAAVRRIGKEGGELWGLPRERRIGKFIRCRLERLDRIDTRETDGVTTANHGIAIEI
jgi:hypothetical protein